MYIENYKKKEYSFLCIGAVHIDHALHLKNNYYKKRTNPVKHYSSLGGVAYNIANKLSFLNLKTSLISLNCSKEIKQEIKKNNIIFNTINKKILNRSYTSIINSNGEMILGLADMENYEKNINIKIKNFNKKIIILDLNLSNKIIDRIIKKNFINNFICVCGTSAYKVNKIKNNLNKINTLILNKQESYNLTNKKNIKMALLDIVKKNIKITIIITNGKNSILAYHQKKLYQCKPPKVKINNENKAGDVMSAFFYYYFFQKLKFETIICKSIAAGSLYVSGYHSSKKNFLRKINKISKKINVKTSKHYG